MRIVNQVCSDYQLQFGYFADFALNVSYMPSAASRLARDVADGLRLLHHFDTILVLPQCTLLIQQILNVLA